LLRYAGGLLYHYSLVAATQFLPRASLVLRLAPQKYHAETQAWSLKRPFDRQKSVSLLFIVYLHCKTLLSTQLCPSDHCSCLKTASIASFHFTTRFYST
jgi:tRNA(His) 5'-end guanylyltransferase